MLDNFIHVKENHSYIKSLVHLGNLQSSSSAIPHILFEVTGQRVAPKSSRAGWKKLSTWPTSEKFRISTFEEHRGLLQMLM